MQAHEHVQLGSVWVPGADAGSTGESKARLFEGLGDLWEVGFGNHPCL